MVSQAPAALQVQVHPAPIAMTVRIVNKTAAAKPVVLASMTKPPPVPSHTAAPPAATTPGRLAATAAGMAGMDAYVSSPALDPALLAGPVSHLCAARVRLLASMPLVGTNAWSLWCRKCGALREGMGGAGPRAPRPGKTLDCGDPMLAATVAAAAVFDDDPPKSFDEFERELHRTLAALDGPRALAAATAPPTLTPSRRRKAPRCTSCGEKFKRPTPVPPVFASARRVRRVTIVNLEVRAADPTDKPATLADASRDLSAGAPPPPKRSRADMDADNGDAGDGVVNTATPPGPPAAPAAPLSVYAAAPAPGDDDVDCTPVVPVLPVIRPPATALARTPSLAHIPTSDPTPPTYPKPPVVAPPAPGGASPPRQLPLANPPAKKRKIKKSGLAKLLAQNAAREAQKTGSGHWGLG